MMNRYTPWLGAVLGCLYFFLLYNQKILNPEFIQWTLEGDAATHFLGWHFFRSEPWHFPLGVIKSYQYPEGTSIVYTDSIPLFALLLKLVSPILPDTFQYHGIWLLLTYLLQGFFSALLLSRFSKNPWVVSLGCLFFLMNPVLAYRAGGHESLTAHWLILAALYLYFQEDSLRNRLLWVVTILLAASIHFYILAMVLAIWGGYLLKSYLDQRGVGIGKLVSFAVATVLLVACALWVLGYFVIPTQDAASGGFGHFSMNLLAPINPVPHNWFSFLKPIPFAVEGQYEGLNYFGVGLLLLLVLSTYEYLRNRPVIGTQYTLPLFWVCMVLSTLAISNKVTFSDRVLFEIPLSYPVYAALGVLRSSGRLFWPVAYCMMLVAVVIISRSNSENKTVLVLIIVLAIQVIDFQPMYRNFFLGKKAWVSPLKSEYWDTMAQHYQHLAMVPADRKGDSYVPFSLLAAKHRMTINVGYTARFDRVIRRTYEQTLLKAVQRGEFERDTLYVIQDQNLVTRVMTYSQIDSVTLDGFTVVAYGLKESVSQLFAH